MSQPIVNCPTCGKEVEWSEASRWRPFCSDRCRLIDLGAWAAEEHRVPGREDGIEWPAATDEDPYRD